MPGVRGTGQRWGEGVEGVVRELKLFCFVSFFRCVVLVFGFNTKAL